MKIKFLSERTINRIAAGEVIERPLSVAKELLENSLDAGATEIKIEIVSGGRNLIRVSDNGCGIAKEDLAIAVQRHATSKLDEEDISYIPYLGFRGEALPSIAAVSKTKIISCFQGKDEGWEINIDGGASLGLKPAAHKIGTIVEVRDLFCFTPARLKFLKSESSEVAHCIDLVNRFALSFYDVAFHLTVNGKKTLALEGNKAALKDDPSRVGLILSRDFIENTIFFESSQDYYKVYGYTSIPTYNYATAFKQFFYVNNRVVKDKLISHAVRSAYADLIPGGRYPAIVLFVELPYEAVDVNAHPTKVEVRFKDEKLLRSLIIDAIRGSIASAGPKNSAVIVNKAVDFLRTKQELSPQKGNELFKQPYLSQSSPKGAGDLPDLSDNKTYKAHGSVGYPNILHIPIAGAEGVRGIIENARKNDASKPEINKTCQGECRGRLIDQQELGSQPYSQSNQQPQGRSEGVWHSMHSEISHTTSKEEKMTDAIQEEISPPLGFAKCQINLTYIIAEASDGMVIVDQHAAHERITLSKLSKQILARDVQVQLFLVPEVVELGAISTPLLLEKQGELKEFGIYIERHGVSQIIVTALPALLAGSINVQSFIQDLAAHLNVFSDTVLVQEKVNAICSSIACYNSIRAGQKLSIPEMNAMLRGIESTAFSSQCNHGRPTYTKFTFAHLEKIFERL